MQVTCVGERLLGRNVEVLQTGQFLVDDGRLGKQIPASHPVSVI